MLLTVTALTILLAQHGIVSSGDIKPASVSVPVTNKIADEPRILCKVYYIPFTAETYSAISTRNITQKGWSTDINRPAVFNALLELIGRDGTPAKLDERSVRLCVQVNNPKMNLYVDQNGVVRRGKKEFMVRPIDLLRLNDLLSKVALPPR